MGSSDNFCLRWNDFETNISASFRELRDSSELFDVTLCCDNGSDTLQAHKLVLAACSPLFRRILAHNTHKNPFLYLKGIQLKELKAVLNFMYHGEVNVAQESLNKFLAVAEELAVKGLTTSDTSDTRIPSSYYNDDDEDAPLPARRTGKKGRRPNMNSVSNKRKQELDIADNSMEVDLKRIKADPDEHRDGQDDNGDLFDPTDYEGVGQFDVDTADFDDTLGNSSGAGMSGADKDMVFEEARFSRTNKGHALLLDSEGHRYLLNQKKEKRLYWICQVRHKSTKCKGSAVTEGFRIVKRGGHNHEPSAPKRSLI